MKIVPTVMHIVLKFPDIVTTFVHKFVVERGAEILKSNELLSVLRKGASLQTNGHIMINFTPVYYIIVT